ncbi:hypothetical protein [Gemmatimonas sp.]|uniref:hypothetical protein n=1 Tax=Gemmatimonas sp. TaxID=1962908 RepID=UPI00286DE854|nr:hypothetical protein [Gemmatimonas sp.]
MTLLESIIASLLLAVTAVVCLDATRGAAALQQRSVAWTQAVAQAEAELATVSSGGLPSSGTRVARRPWRDGLDRLEVEVPMAGGATFRLTRLVERAP